MKIMCVDEEYGSAATENIEEPEDGCTEA